jgi:hypothetical protein
VPGDGWQCRTPVAPGATFEAMMRVRTLLAMAVYLLAGCGGKDQPPFPDQPWRQASDVVDSLVPMEELLDRFRTATVPVTAVSGGAESITDFAELFLTAVAERDSSALGGLRISSSEFAWLLAEDHIYTRPPYDLDPSLLWMQISAGSDKGLRRLLERLGGRPLTIVSTTCQSDTLQFSGNAVKAWSDCQIRWRDGSDESAGRLFGTVVERDGRFKVLGYGNDY